MVTSLSTGIGFAGLNSTVVGGYAERGKFQESTSKILSELVRAAGSVLQAGDGSKVHTAEMSNFSVAFLEMQELMWSLILATTFRF